MITKISWEEICQIWSTELWPTRQSPIEPNSAMVYLGGYLDYNKQTTPTFFGYKINKNIIAVNSGHMCADNMYRSRGLWVHPNYRNQSFGQILLTATINQAIIENATMVWSYPRKTSVKTYEAVGFIITSPWEKSETSDHNAYCSLLITNHHKSIIPARIKSHLDVMNP